MTFSSTGAKHKPALDEGSFQQLLAAAYVVQQHNETALKEEAPAGTSRVLSIIAEIQSFIRTQSLNVADSAALIAERLLSLVAASGVSISLVENGYLDCVAEAGVPAKLPGSSVCSHSAIATEHLKSGQIFESDDCQMDARLDPRLCQNAGAASLVAAPVFRFGQIAGLVEVRWTKPHSFAEPELRTCRMMAGLVTGTLERSVRIGNAMTATTPSTPQLDIAGLADNTKTSNDDSIETANIRAELEPRLSESPTKSLAKSDAAEATPPSVHGAPAPCCRMCGRPFAADEQFCGFCSMPRPVENPDTELQSKWASLWFMQRAQDVLRETQPPSTQVEDKEAREEDESRAESIPDLFPEPAASPIEPRPLMWPRRAPPEPVAEPKMLPQVEAVAAEVSFPFDERLPLSERTGNFLKRQWRNGILAMVALALAYGLITAWPKPGQQTWFQALLVRIGVHKSTKVFAGAPDARVWIDVHTQLYYCSGEDLYGKTPDGEFTTQYNAQSDGFLPASNTTCP